MKLVIPKEIAQDETRVAATPETVKKLVKDGFTVLVESGAGSKASFLDEDYKSQGAQIVSEAENLYAEADIIFKVERPIFNQNTKKHEADLIKKGAILISFLRPLVDKEIAKKLAERNITAFAMEMIPRIARAQKLDALSSQSNVAGYKAVLMAANATGKMMPLLMTAAGTVTPAKVFVIGAGVAGLQAIATAKRLGAIVEAFDTRPQVKEQVESLGGKFATFDVPSGSDSEDKRGYAKELSKEAHQKEKEFLTSAVSDADIVITTALIPGKGAPKLISEDMVQKMRHGSVIVDLASEAGGNCELTEPGKDVVKHGVTIIGRRNVAGLMPQQSSQLYARNIMFFLGEFYKKGEINIDLENQVLKDSLITHEGKIVNSMLQEGSKR